MGNQQSRIFRKTRKGKKSGVISEKSGRRSKKPAEGAVESEDTGETVVVDETNETTGSLSLETLEKFSDEFNGEPKNILAMNAITSDDMSKVLFSREAAVNDIHVFSEKIELEGKATNQKSSGRCWLFAATNVMRLIVMKKYGLDEFELSQAYLFFYDKLEKANFFLENMIELAGKEDVDGRLVQYLLQAPVNDGGQWDMVINLLEKYGIVPKTAYPESYNSSDTYKLNWLVTAKLREYAHRLRQSFDNGKNINAIRREKVKMMQSIYRILAISLGEPPKEFDWTFRNKDGKYFQFLNLTPKQYYRDIGYKATETFSLINDPRNEYLRLYTVEYLGNIHGGLPIRYVNVPIKQMKDLAIKVLRSGKPVWFGADVGKHSNSYLGILDNNIYDYSLGFNIAFKLDKGSRLKFGESLMTHAMVFTGVHLENGEPVRWRVENSWGDDRGEKGYFVMQDNWFDSWVYQIVVENKDASTELTSVLSQKPHVLPAWDPMGALAAKI